MDVREKSSNEKRLIDANALVKDIELLAKHEDSFRQSVILGVVHTVKAQSTVDAVEVVRCRECKKHCEANGKHYCKFWRMYCPDDSDFFCKAGERKEGAD